MLLILIGLFLGILACIPMLLLKFKYFTHSYGYEVFVRNYIFFVHYLFFTMLVLYILNKFIIKMDKKWIGVLTVIIVLIIGFVGRRNFSIPKIVKTNIKIDKKSDLETFKIAFMSDLHLSMTADKNMYIETFKKISEENPDIVLIGGDFIDNSYTQVRDEYESVIKLLNPKYGVYLIIGNHEYYGGIDGNINYIKSLGINILRDEKLEIEGITIIGRDDDHNKERKDLEILLEGVSKENPIIVVDHNPNSIKTSIENNVDLQLSGHTHMGQFFPYNLVVKKMYDNPGGYKKFNETNTIVSSGLGAWLIPYRIATNSDVQIITLEFKK